MKRATFIANKLLLSYFMVEETDLRAACAIAYRKFANTVKVQNKCSRPLACIEINFRGG